jgi:hypothetical protein
LSKINFWHSCWENNCALITELSLSQYKTRIGLLICHYITKYKNDSIKINYFILYLSEVTKLIESANITLLQRLRLYIFYLRKKLENHDSLNDIDIFRHIYN